MEKQSVLNIMSVCLYACLLVIPQAKRIFCHVACPDLPQRPKLYRELHDFRGIKLLKHTMCFDFLYIFRPKHFSF